MTRPVKVQKLRRKAAKPASLKGPARDRREEIRLDTIGQVAAVLSHESRNLLGALGTCVQVLRRNPHLSADDNELLDIVQSGAHRLSEVVEQFVIFRRPTPPRLNAVYLHELIEVTLDRLHQDERCSAEIVIERRFDPNIESITADAEGLRRAFWELCLNGAQAIGRRGLLSVETRRAGEKVFITVRDSGPGIDAGLKRNIFEPLFTTKTRATGLGLAIVNRIVEQHRGAVGFESQPGKGASFTISLPSASESKKNQPSSRRLDARSIHGR